MSYDIIIIGAGAAGLFTAVNIEKGSVLILEKNSSAGKKILISGGGKCNFTNSESKEELLKHYYEHRNFLKHAIYNYSNTDIINYFGEMGIDTKIDEQGRVFPESEKSTDILKALLSTCDNKNIAFHYNTTVNDTFKKGNDFIIKSNKGILLSKVLVIASGGKSYPVTGSSGDGYKFAKKFKHSIISPKPALTPFRIKNSKKLKLYGISLKRKYISLYRMGKEIIKTKNDILFTHDGISGPAVLNISRYAERGDVLKIDLTGFANEEMLKRDLRKKIEENKRKKIINILKMYDIPERIIFVIFNNLNIPLNLYSYELKKRIRENLIHSIVNFTLYIDRVDGFNKAMVTRGGIDLSEINSKTMESRLVKNLYFAGEIIDIDGETGGYNIQSAFSTGKLAADSINFNNKD